MRRKVAFWGGTFDPPHYGHLGIAKRLLESKRSNLVLFVPAFAPPHKNNNVISPYHHRLAMLKLALSDEKDMEISEAERELNATPSYTFLIMEYLEKLRPNDELQLLIGGDSLAYLHTWHRAKELLNRWEILTFPRSGNREFDQDFLRKYWSDMETQKLQKGILKAPLFEISSTAVRQKLNDQMSVANDIPYDVLNYIKENKLYIGQSEKGEKNE